MFTFETGAAESHFFFDFFLILLFLGHFGKGLHDNGQEQIKKEEGADYNQNGEVEASDETRGVHIVVHDSRPSLKCDCSKNGHDRSTDVIKVKVTILNIIPGCDIIKF